MAEPITADIVVYGGSFAGVAAAAKASGIADTWQVLLVAADPIRQLGSVGTIGGLNFFDRRTWKGVDPQQGSFSYWRAVQGDFYNTDAMARQLLSDLTGHANLSILWGYEIEAVAASADGLRITQLALRTVQRDATGLTVWGTDRTIVSGSVFVDASDDGRLARLAGGGASVTNGRYDWPSQFLDADETGPAGRARQQAATLQFKVRGVAPGGQNTSGDMSWLVDANGTRAVFGGGPTYRNNPTVRAFNDTYGPRGYAMKPLNAAQNGPGSAEWWVNTLLLFGVDGRAHSFDLNTPNYPPDIRPDYKNLDQARVDARRFVASTSALMEALRQFGGFRSATLVMADDGLPATGEIVYIRKTLHTVLDPAQRGNDTENLNYALNAIEVQGADAGPTWGTDIANYPHRVGLISYWMDINGYKFADMKDAAGQYVWPVTRRVRPDWPGEPYAPAYAPFETLLSPAAANLLVAGGAAGASSFAWAELRTVPNLCVLGDAAGVAAAHGVRTGILPRFFSGAAIGQVQRLLTTRANVRLEK